MPPENQFGFNTNPYNIPKATDYRSMQGYSMPGVSVYTGAANGYQPPQQTFSDYVSPEASAPMSFMEQWGTNGFKGVNQWAQDNGIIGSTNMKTGMRTDSLLGSGLGLAQGLLGGYMGMKQYGLAKQSLAQGKDQFERNYAAQKATTNAALEDRQRARVSGNPNAYQSVGDYMNKHGIK